MRLGRGRLSRIHEASRCQSIRNTENEKARLAPEAVQFQHEACRAPAGGFWEGASPQDTRAKGGARDPVEHDGDLQSPFAA